MNGLRRPFHGDGMIGRFRNARSAKDNGPCRNLVNDLPGINRLSKRIPEPDEHRFINLAREFCFQDCGVPLPFARFQIEKPLRDRSGL